MTPAIEERSAHPTGNISENVAPGSLRFTPVTRGYVLAGEPGGVCVSVMESGEVFVSMIDHRRVTRGGHLLRFSDL